MDNKILVKIIILAVILGGAYFLFVSRSPESSTSKDDEVMEGEEISSVTYRDEVMGYEVQYPSTWSDTERFYGEDTFQLMNDDDTYAFITRNKNSQGLNMWDNPECFEFVKLAQFNQFNWTINKELCVNGLHVTEISASVDVDDIYIRILANSSSDLESTIEKLENILANFKW